MARKRDVILSAAGSGVDLAVRASRWFVDWPPARRELPVSTSSAAPALPRNTPVRMLVWNVQFCAGRSQKFFYDGGDAVSVERESVSQTIDEVATAIRALDPDIVLLQEVDRDSDRTGRIDQHRALLSKLDYPADTSATYHNVRYVPHPTHGHLGRVNMHMSVFSRYRITRATRYQLPLLDESLFRQVFNLRRALLDVRVALEGGGELILFNTHLSAFSKGDGTLPRQVAMLLSHAAAADERGNPWILAGDMNSLPPGFDRARLPDFDQSWYADSGSPLAPMFDRFASPVTPAAMVADPGVYGTYGPFQARVADRTLDYVFHGDSVTPSAYDVIGGHLGTSDHLPVVMSFTVS